MNRTNGASLLIVLVLVAAAALLVIHQDRRITSLEYRVQELNCVHIIFEDGDAIHTDAEVALECLRRQLGSGWRPEGDRG